MNRPTPLAERSSGVLLHLTSLPGPHGHGDLGPAAHRFARFLRDAGQRWWQMLPVVPPGAGNSPYVSVSSSAGGALLISLDGLVAEGWLAEADLAAPRSLTGARAQYARAASFRATRLRKAFANFVTRPTQRRQLQRYRERNQDWLDDYALFRALQHAHGGATWTDWDRALRDRQSSALNRARRQLSDELRYHAFLQYVFDRQWLALQRHCRTLGLRLLGDVPMFVAHDSADVWANRELFDLDRRGCARAVAGVPPDAFSRTGQLWGNPLYCWERLRESEFAWWVARLRRNLRRFDAVRLDHFIGFHRCWRVAAGARTAKRGRFVRVPGARLLGTLEASLGGLPFVAEDLGLLTPEVHALRDQFELPGMRVLQFGFDDDAGRHYQPHRYPPRCIAYTGTHDNDTVVGWYRSLPPPGNAEARRRALERRRYVLRYVGGGATEIHWQLIRVVLASAANTAIFPMQDLLGLDSRARMNTPGTARGNWEWRLAADQLDPRVAERLGRMCDDYERIPQRR
jgi:4-alpha-glucanotransferase